MIRYYTLISHDIPSRRRSFYHGVQKVTGELSIGWGKVNPIGSTPGKIRSDLLREYPKKKKLNIHNGTNSLGLFATLSPGDLIFVRGKSAILDVGVILDKPVYNYAKGHGGDAGYCLRSKYSPLFADRALELKVKDVDAQFKPSFVFDKGRSMTMKEISANMAASLLSKMLQRP